MITVVSIIGTTELIKMSGYTNKQLCKSYIYTYWSKLYMN